MATRDTAMSSCMCGNCKMVEVCWTVIRAEDREDGNHFRDFVDCDCMKCNCCYECDETE